MGFSSVKNGETTKSTEDLYRVVLASDLTVEELRECGLPDEYLFEISVGFKSKENVPYDASHISMRRDDKESRGYKKRSYIILMGPEKFRYDFMNTQETILDLTGGKLEGPEIGENDKIIKLGIPYMSSKIILRREVTRKEVAELVQGYSDVGFREVRINLARFYDVPIEAIGAYENHGLPPHKLKIL